MNARSLLPLCFAMAGLVALPRAGAQTAATASDSSGSPAIVYRLTFEVAGESINFRPFQGGFYIAPVTGGSGTLILTRRQGNERTYYSFENFGQLFLAKNGSSRKAVLSTSTGTQLEDQGTLSTTALFAIGDANEKFDTETASAGDIYYAEELKGYGVSADSERDLPFSGSATADVGVAGATTLRAYIDLSRTQSSLKKSTTVQTVVDEIVAGLQEDSYVDGLDANAASANAGAGAGANSGAGNGAGAGGR